jgi:hypothetical protein
MDRRGREVEVGGGNDDEEKEQEVPWESSPAWRDEGISWELGGMALLPLRHACEAFVVFAEALLVPGDPSKPALESSAAAAAIDMPGLADACQTALAVATWLAARPPLGEGAMKAAGTTEPATTTAVPPSVHEPQAASAASGSPPVDGSSALQSQLPGALRLPLGDKARGRLLGLITRIDSYLSQSCSLPASA